MGLDGRRKYDARKGCRLARAVNGKDNLPFIQVFLFRPKFALLFPTSRER